MKVLIKKMGLLLCLLLLCSYAGAKGKEPDYTMDSGHVMDANWYQYLTTWDEEYLENILVYIDTEDLLMKNVNQKAKTFLKDEKFVGSMKKLGAEVKNNKFELDYDLELLVGFLIQDEEFAADIQYVYSFFPEDLFIRGVMKNTAFWSVMSNAEQYEVTNIAVQKRIPYFNEKVQASCYMYLERDDKIGFVKTDKGAAEFDNGKIHIMSLLVNDMDKAVEDWNTLDAEEAPVIKTSTEVNLKKGLDSIAPFIVFNVNGDVDYPLYYDAELIHPDGKLSSVGVKKLNFTDREPENRNYLYSVMQSFKWVFDKSDTAGTYTVKVTVYSAKNVLCIFEQAFKLKK